MIISAAARRLASISLVMAMAAPPAFAQQDGVFVDPESPSGKEYAVPLDQARGEAAGGGERVPGEEPLFGAGIKPPSGHTGNAQSSKDAGKKDGGSGGAGSEPRQRDGSGGSVGLGQSPAAIEAAAADGSDGLLSAGIAAAVLAGGLLVGVGLRRLLRTE